MVVMPAQPFPDWLQRADPTSVEVSLEDLRREPAICLLPECENEEAAREYLREVCGGIFEEQLNGWYLIPAAWPTLRDLNAFDQGFEYRFHSTLVNLCDAPLFQEEV